MNQHASDIVGTALRFFMKYGIKSVSMDDIARELGISKKTLYKHFDSKKQLIEAVTAKHSEDEQREMLAIQESAENAIDEMVRMTHYIRGMLRELKPTIIFDLKKYHRESWKRIEAIHTDFVYTTLHNNLTSGQRDGLYRKALDMDVIARLYTGITMMMMDEEVFSSETYKKEDLYKQYIDYHLHGILTQEGHRQYHKYVTQ